MLPYVNVTPEEVIAVMQARFPKELEICVLTIQNQKLQKDRLYILKIVKEILLIEF